MLFYSTTIFLIRDPFRKVFLSSDVPLSVVITHTWFAPILCPFIAILLYFCFWLPFTTLPSTSLVPSYSFALSTFAISAWLESFAEPYVILSLRYGLDAQYAFIQAFLLIMQRVFVLVLVNTMSFVPVYAFCFAQVLSSCCYTLLCIYLLISNIRRAGISIKGFDVVYLYPHFPGALSKENMSVLGTFMVHSIFKQVLTDGTGYVLTFTNFFTLSDQAVFDAVEKIGSLVARIIFAPVEHSAYLYFSSCFRRASSMESRNEVEVKKGLNAMNGLLHIVAVIGIVVFTFALTYSPLVVKLYGGDLLVNSLGANILRFYCFYIIVIAINGVTECFAMATMSKEQLCSHGWFLVLSSPLHILLSSLLSYVLGSYGLILANVINMVMRIAYCWQHVRRFSCGQVNFLKIFPDFSTNFILFFCLIITSISLLIFGQVDGIMYSAAHVAVGGALLLVVVNHVYQNDIQLAKFLHDRFLEVHED
ncbi:unnamed protein product [Thelazia callipaeda]|uniref:Protein RFT1 homolog n=1 Tax=Thelazia callipaeda TaxID=103827 RepID=A0A0N5D4C9_THECL|nr:unnamed protein product [Thelazia callipaeda]